MCLQPSIAQSNCLKVTLTLKKLMKQNTMVCLNGFIFCLYSVFVAQVQKKNTTVRQLNGLFLLLSVLVTQKKKGLKCFILISEFLQVRLGCTCTCTSKTAHPLEYQSDKVELW